GSGQPNDVLRQWRQPPQPRGRSGRRLRRVSYVKPPGGRNRTLLRPQGLLWRCAGVAELANALGLGPSGAEVPYRFKSCRPHFWANHASTRICVTARLNATSSNRYGVAFASWWVGPSRSSEPSAALIAYRSGISWV